jgi:serine/threonine protein phosphatase 1
MIHEGFSHHSPLTSHLSPFTSHFFFDLCIMARRIVIGDVHGCLRTFRRLVEDRISLSQEDELFLVGDLIDRGPDSKGVIDYVLELMNKGHQVTTIRGNHEEMLLETAGDERFLATWLYNGAEATIRSFGMDFDLETAGHVDQYVGERYFDFLNGLGYYIELEDYFIVHAGFNFGITDPLSDTQAMIWSRDMSYDREKAQGKRVIHGHTPVTLEEIRHVVYEGSEPLVNIDAGCVYLYYPGLGNLVGIDLDERELFIQKNCEVH